MEQNLPDDRRYWNNAVVPVDIARLPEIRGYSNQPYPNYGPSEIENAESAGLDIYKYIRIFIKYRWLLIITTLLSLLVGGLLTMLMTPIYRATASLQIDRETMNVVKIEGIQPEESQRGVEFFQTQYELIASRSLAERVVATLSLPANPDFNVETKSLVGTLKELVLPSSNDQSTKVRSQEDKDARAVSKLLTSLNVAPVRGSRIVKISFDHPDPEVAKTVINGYAEVYIAENLDRRFEATAYARKFLEERLQQLKVKLEETERQLVKYSEEQGIINLEGNQNLSAKDLENINDKLSIVRSERIKKELLWKQAQQTDGFGLKEILDSKAIQENRTLRAKFAAEYQQKLAIYKPAFPDMVQLRNQIKELDRQVQSEIAAIKNAIESQYVAAVEEEKELETQLEGTKVDVVEQRNRSIEYNIIQREVDTNRQLYEGLLQRYKEIGVAGGVGTNNISVVDKAVTPSSPRSPRLLLNMLAALLSGVGLGVALALLLNYLDDSFKSPEDIERELGLPVVGVVPLPSRNRTIDEELLDPRSGPAEAYRSLRTSLQFATSDGLPRNLLVTSSKPSEGKTTTTISIAKSLTQIGLNVLLIDGDLRNASVHKRMKLVNTVGLSNYLSGSKPPEDVVQHSAFDGLVVMTSGPLPPNPAELLSGPRLASLLALAAGSFDVVLIDGPPVMGLADSPMLSSMVHSTMLVVAANETRRSSVKVALRRLQNSRANVIGALLNKFDTKEAGYGYGYGDYEYHSYGGAEVGLLPEK